MKDVSVKGVIDVFFYDIMIFLSKIYDII